MIGTKGSGKSSTGNCILGKKKFKVFVGTKNRTENIQKEKTEYFDTTLTVIDTPGVQDLNDLKKNMSNLHVPETTVYAIVIAIGRYTTLDKHMLEVIRTNYDILKRSIIIFTRRNELDTFENENEKTIDRWLSSVKTLSSFIDDHNIKIRVFENNDNDSKATSAQVKGVIDLCNEMIHGHIDNDNEINKSTITVDYKEMKRAFGEKGVEFFEEKMKSKGKNS